MTPKWENGLTWGLVGLCAALVVLNLWPRLTVGRVEVVEETPDITVSIAGAVRAPGVYTLPWGSRTETLVEAAGGLTSSAEKTLINLAAPLDTGDTIFVPTAQTESGETRLSLNSATLAELDTLPGVGPATAQKIAAARPFNSVDDLLDVSGIGPATLEKLRPLVKP